MILRDVVEHASHSLGISIWDHPGRTTIGEEACFVLEPYPDSDRDRYEQRLQEISLRLSQLLQCSVTWSRESWHYPDWAYRIIFSEGRKMNSYVEDEHSKAALLEPQVRAESPDVAKVLDWKNDLLSSLRARVNFQAAEIEFLKRQLREVGVSV
jgi:hypothetical protein